APTCQKQISRPGSVPTISRRSSSSLRPMTRMRSPAHSSRSWAASKQTPRVTTQSQGVWIAYAQVAASFVLVGISVPLAKLMVRDLPIFLACGVRFVAAVSVAFPLLWWRGESLRGIAPRDHRLLFAQALPGVFLFPVLLFEGLKTANGTATGVALGTMPAVV